MILYLLLQSISRVVLVLNEIFFKLVILALETGVNSLIVAFSPNDSSSVTRWPKPLRDHRGAGPLDTSHLLFRDHLSAHSTGARATSETSFRGQAQLDTGAQHRRGKVRGGAPSTTCGTENLRRPSRAQVPLRYFWTGEVR